MFNPKKLIFVLLFIFISKANYTLDEENLEKIDIIVNEAIQNKQIPGAVVCIGQDKSVIYHRAYGENIEKNTIFDLASLTKIFTALSIFILAQDGKIRLKSYVSDYLPEFKQNSKDEITIEHCLLHSTGLASNAPIALFSGSQSDILKNLCALPVINKIGQVFNYSDTGYIILGKIIEKVANCKLNYFIEKKILNPLSMYDSSFLPNKNKLNRIAPTGYRNNSLIIGQVHDDRANLLGGVAGHAGLFSTSCDLFNFCSMILNPQENCILNTFALKKFIEPQRLPDGNIRAFGFDVKTKFSRSLGDFFPFGTLTHSGWTGTSIVIDPTTKIFIIILTNRTLLPTGDVINLRGAIANIVATSIKEKIS